MDARTNFVCFLRDRGFTQEAISACIRGKGLLDAVTALRFDEGKIKCDLKGARVLLASALGLPITSEWEPVRLKLHDLQRQEKARE